jgi:hypothetical protein
MSLKIILKNCDLYFCRNASLTELKIVLIITCGLVGEATGCINEGDITCSCCWMTTFGWKTTGEGWLKIGLLCDVRTIPWERQDNKCQCIQSLYLLVILW